MMNLLNSTSYLVERNRMSNKPVYTSILLKHMLLHQRQKRKHEERLIFDRLFVRVFPKS